MSKKLVDITLEEAINVLRLGEGYQKGVHYHLRVKNSVQDKGKKFAQLFYRHKGRRDDEERDYISVNFCDEENAVTLCEGNKYYRTHYRITKYLEGQGFNLKSADKTR
ncbi:MAG: hypothetical protein KKB62_01740 [Nanoarchaeota archaeon]|nr:hypothetical protein [Nanoarchaeota archaeon]